MKLLIQGFHYRTSGSAAPFDTFTCEFDNVESLVRQKLDVGCRGYAVRIYCLYDYGVDLTFFDEVGEESLRINLGQRELRRRVRGILGLEVIFELRK